MSYRPLPTTHSDYLVIGDYAIARDGVVFQADGDFWERRSGFVSESGIWIITDAWRNPKIDEEVVIRIAAAVVENATSINAPSPNFSAN